MNQKNRNESTGTLDRFLEAQEGVYAQALLELKRGRKKSHWMWFIFPQIEGLGSSGMARRYAIADLQEAIAYLAHPVLGPRLVECCRALLELENLTAAEIFGYPDDLKLRSSMTLFALASGKPGSLFTRVLEQYYGGEQDSRTNSLLRLNEP